MATVLTSSLPAGVPRELKERRERGLAAGVVSVLTLLALAVHGYHPYVEDGALYVQEIKKILRPELYPCQTEFVVGHLGFSLFAPLMAGLARWSHLKIEVVLLVVYVAALWLTLFAGWMLARRCFRSSEAQWGAVGVLAAWITLPVAGTTLLLMDPYVTARSICTPCSLLALVGALEWKIQRDKHGKKMAGLWMLCGAMLVAIAIHPLMGIYALGSVLVLICLQARSRVQLWGTAGLCGLALTVALVMQATAGPESELYRKAALTRSYWFLTKWEWYEVLGLVAPLLIAAVVGFGQRSVDFERGGKTSAALTALCRMAVITGACAMVTAMLFARPGATLHEVARLQPLRIFQMVYIVMILMVGAALGEWVLRRQVARWIVVISLLGGVMTAAERATFPSSSHLELPWNEQRSKNAWVQAFLWVRNNTPVDALFAMDPRYIVAKGEDAQGFRAIAERSALPDYTKDGGVAAIKPELDEQWMQGQIAQSRLNVETDAERTAALRPLHVGWVILSKDSRTEFACEYANDTVKVCRLPQLRATAPEN